MTSTDTTLPEGVAAATAARAPWRRWPDWVAYAAAAWSLIYGAFGLYWAFGGPGFPFGDGDPGSALSVLAGVRAETGAPVIAALGLTGVVVALTMARTRGQRVGRWLPLAFAWGAVATLFFVVCDYRLLVHTAYTIVFLAGAPFGWPPGSYHVTWPVVNQFACVGGGLLWAATAVAYGRRARDGCGHCGRTDERAGWTTPAAAARWGRWATYVAVVVPCLYAATRWAWALGIPLGISEEFLREGQRTGLWMIGAALATLGVGGAILTLGLIQRWGEVFPQWMVGLAGKRVPPGLAIVPASMVAVLVTIAGLMYVRMALTGGFETFGFGGEENWAAIGPELLWPLWGAALGAATLAYYYRRRGRCRTCGRPSATQA